MKPLNLNTESCNPISSNCVIWQGPDIECINLCKGDTVTDVVYKLATELCTLLDSLKIDSFDITCFNLNNCGPENFHELIQFLIDKICELENVTPPPTPGNEGCPDCVVNVAECFYYQNNFGDTVTTMQLTDYVNAIGNKLCLIVNNITIIQQTIDNQGDRITALENATPPSYTPPTVVPTCVLPAESTEMDVMLEALEEQFCLLREATGLPVDIYTGIASQCAGLSEDPRLSGLGAMSSIPGWNVEVSNLGDAFTNMWLTICDMRSAIKFIKTNCCPSGCDGISIDMYASIVGDTVTIFFSGTIPAGFNQCAGSTQLTITDSASNSVTQNFNLISNMNVLTGYSLNLESTPINTALDLTFQITPCLTNPTENVTCQSEVSYVLVNTSTCPLITITANDYQIGYLFTAITGAFTYTIELWNATNTMMISTQTQPVTGPLPVNGIFSLLTPGTNYNIRVSIVPTACLECTPTICPFVPAATTNACPAPSNVVPSFTPAP
jgi:hypothetical protein